MANKSKDQTFGSEWSGSIAGTVMLLDPSNTSLKSVSEWWEPMENAMLGTKRPGNTGRQVVKDDVSGTVGVFPSYAHANTILQQIMDESTGTFTPMDAPEDMDVGDIVIDKSVIVHTYADAQCNELRLSGGENEPLVWILDLLGRTEAVSGSVAALTPPDCMLFSDVSFSLNSNAYFPTRMELRFGYQLSDRFHNSVTRSSAMSQFDSCELDLTFDINADTYADVAVLAGTDTAIDDVVLTITDGTSTITVTMDRTTNMSPHVIPDPGGTDAIQDTITLKGWLKSGSTDIVVMTYAAA